MTKWPSDPSDQVTKWPSDWVTEWLSDRVTKWLSERLFDWLSDRVTKWQEASQTIDRMVYFINVLLGLVYDPLVFGHLLT